MRVGWKSLWSVVVLCLLVGTVYSATLLYRAKGETRAAIRASDRLESRARELRAEISALDVEWAYLTGPENLNRLVDLYSDELKLEERVPDSFARLSEIPIRGAGLDTSTDAEDSARE